MVDINTRPMSVVEFRKLVEHDDRLLELWPDGIVREKPPMSMGHSRLTVAVGALLEAKLGRERAYVAAEPITEWGDRPAFRPDVVLYSRERSRALVERLGWSGYADEPPDLVVEILSPSQSWGELADKCTWYVRHGVPVAWLIDFQQRQVGGFRAGTAGLDVYRDGDRRSLPLPEAFSAPTLVAADVFALLEP